MSRVLLALFALVYLVAPAAADKRGKRVVTTDTAIVLADPIYFETGKAVIKAESFALLDAVTATLAADAHIAFVEIQVHTDERGDADWNLAVSQKRADAIRDYLVAKGIDAKRLRAKGYGETKPLDKRHTAAA